MTCSTAISRNLIRLAEALAGLRTTDFDRIAKWAMEAEHRDPRITPSYLDKLMASAGGNSARYLDVRHFDGQTVFCRESCAPFANDGRAKSMPIKKWQAWASKASIMHRASKETSIPGLPGYWTNWEVFEAMEHLKNETAIESSLVV